MRREPENPESAKHANMALSNLVDRLFVSPLPHSARPEAEPHFACLVLRRSRRRSPTARKACLERVRMPIPLRRGNTRPGSLITPCPPTAALCHEVEADMKIHPPTMPPSGRATHHIFKVRCAANHRITAAVLLLDVVVVVDLLRVGESRSQAKHEALNRFLSFHCVVSMLAPLQAGPAESNNEAEKKPMHLQHARQPTTSTSPSTEVPAKELGGSTQTVGFGIKRPRRKRPTSTRRGATNSIRPPRRRIQVCRSKWPSYPVASLLPFSSSLPPAPSPQPSRLHPSPLLSSPP